MIFKYLTCTDWCNVIVEYNEMIWYIPQVMEHILHDLNSTRTCITCILYWQCMIPIFSLSKQQKHLMPFTLAWSDRRPPVAHSLQARHSHLHWCQNWLAAQIIQALFTIHGSILPRGLWMNFGLWEYWVLQANGSNQGNWYNWYNKWNIIYITVIISGTIFSQLIVNTTYQLFYPLARTKQHPLKIEGSNGVFIEKKHRNFHFQELSTPLLRGKSSENPPQKSEKKKNKTISPLQVLKDKNKKIVYNKNI